MTEPAGLTDRLVRVEEQARENASRLIEHERELYGDPRRGDQGLVFALRENTAMQQLRINADVEWRKRQAIMMWGVVIMAALAVVIASVALSVSVSVVQSLAMVL